MCEFYFCNWDFCNLHSLCNNATYLLRGNRPQCNSSLNFWRESQPAYLTAWETHTGCCNFRFSSFVPLFSDTVRTLGELLPICPLLLTHLLAYSMSYIFTYIRQYKESESYLLSSNVQKCITSSILYIVYRSVSYLLFSSGQRCIISSTILDTEIYPIFHLPGK